ncbi:immunoglobulin superfamily member 11-like [Anolis sagrei]|uniref:immunoglobulin superfamily member 11-like n=1 Tax=Anolis sagrei TaxID=38937 RepID=UPI003521DFCA
MGCPAKAKGLCARFLGFGILLLGCGTASLAVRVSVAASSIQVVRGGSALLPCSFQTTAPLDRLNIIWTVDPSSDPGRPQQVLSYEGGQVVESVSGFTGRASFAFPPTASATLLLNDTRGSDSGRYQCSVLNPPDNQLPNIGVVQLTVFVPPSGPQCWREGDSGEGDGLRFACSVGDGVPHPTFTWEKIPADAWHPLVTTYEGDRRALLTLHNVTSSASGLYRCTASNMLGSASCALELHVHLPPDGATSLVVGIALLLAMGTVLLALMALVLWLHQRGLRKQREGAHHDHDDEESHNEIRMDSFSLGRLRVAKGGPPPARPLWVFTSAAPNATFAHREWRTTAATPTLPGGTADPHAPLEEEEPLPAPGPFPRPTGFLV